MTDLFADRFRIDRELGRGSFGIVYLAFDTRLQDRPVALKLLHPGLDADPTVVRQFQREAGVLARLEHPAIVPIYDAGAEEGRRYLVMRYVAGRSLAKVLADEGPQPPERVFGWLGQIAAGLDYAHGQDVLHRDLKPANLLLDEARGQVLISDFGLAQAVMSSGGSASMSHGMMTGTALYMAPEVILGQPHIAASDRYSLGCALYELLDGKPQFTGDNVVAVTHQHVHSPPRPLALAGDVGEALAEQVMAMLAKVPEGRPSTATQAHTAVVDGMRRREEARQAAAAQEVARQAEAARKAERERQQRAAEETVRQEAAHKAEAERLRQEKEKAAAEHEATEHRRQEQAGAEQARQEAARREREQEGAQKLRPGWHRAGGGTPSSEAKPMWQRWPLWAGLALVAVVGFLLLRGLREADNRSEPTLRPDLGIGSTMISDKDGMELVYVPEGAFLIGSAVDDAEADDDTKPQHMVYLDAYWIDKTEVTNDQYRKCVAVGSCAQPPGSDYKNAARGRHPVVQVSWNDAMAYCEWAGRRLPTEAEWEKAARGTDGRIYPWGNAAPDSALANFAQNLGWTAAVGSYAAGASPYGAMDMAGNVWEWVGDWYGAGYYANAPRPNPRGPETGDGRVLRGGSWLVASPLIRTTNRSWYFLDFRLVSNGFRCARSP